MKTKRFLQLTHAMCEQAVLEAFDKKWFRRDYLATVEKYGGVSRAELSRAARLNDWNPRLEAVNSIALEMEQRVEDLVEGEADDLDLEPVSVFYRIDGISMKRRELSNCHPMHQAFGHLAVIGLRPLLRAKLLPYQFASIPGKGQIALKRQVERWLRRKSLGIQHAVKLDVQGAYTVRLFALDGSVQRSPKRVLASALCLGWGARTTICTLGICRKSMWPQVKS